MPGDQIFADGIRSIAVTGTVVRIDFAALSMSSPNDGQSPPMELVERVIMPVDGFVAAVAKLQEVVQLLVKRGVVRPTAGASAPSPGPGMPSLDTAVLAPPASALTTSSSQPAAETPANAEAPQRQRRPFP